MSEMNRREFLGSTAGFAGVGLLAGLAASVHVSHAGAAQPAKKERIRLAVMGVNSRGKQLLNGFTTFPDVEIAYICDPDSNVIAPAVKVVEGRGKKTPKIVKDFRVALEDPEVDALVCAAPDHWHALAGIWACQAGKDAYVEKPCSYNPTEGRRLVDIAHKHKRIVQMGNQRRSSPDLAEAIKIVQSGRLGKVAFTRCWITSTRPNIGHAEVTKAPDNLDFDLWCGPAPNNGYKKNLVHYDWHWRWDYGTGECGNNGIHALDIARWGLGFEYPDRICSGGGKYTFDDDQETPDTQLVTFDYPTGSVQWEHRTWSPRGIEGEAFGIIFYGTDATLVVRGKNWSLYEGKKGTETEKRDIAAFENLHQRNFLDCISTREKPNSEIELGHHSTLLCQLGNIAWRTRSTLKFDGKTETIVGNEEATALMSRPSYRKGFELPSVS